MPSCMASSQSPHPPPAEPIERVAVDAHVVEVDPVLRVGRDRHLLRERHARSPSGRRGRSAGPSGVRASTRSRSAAPAKCTCRLVPVSCQPSPSAFAGSCTPPGPKPRPGSSHAGVMIASPAAIGGQPVLALGSGRGASKNPGAHHRAHEVRRRRERAPELRVHDDGVEHRHAAAAVLLGKRHAEQPELGELLPQLVGVADRVVLHLADDVEARVSRAHAATASRSMSCSGVKSRSIRSPLLGSSRCRFRDASGRRGAPRGCRRVSWAGRRAPSR